MAESAKHVKTERSPGIPRAKVLAAREQAAKAAKPAKPAKKKGD